MITIRTCSTLLDAQLAQSLLKGSDIQAFLPDEFAAQNTWAAIGGVRIQVAEEDVERATEILSQSA